MKLLFILPVLFMAQLSVAQNAVWDKWDSETISMANTAKDFEYYSDEEKKVISFMFPDCDSN